mmetsp:Transcript_15265/g.47692  ORF Transcript_15265/g.47692 Transcript_15265/m.47692 type:complete len:365 (+) Transcript_15265:134-1228(+)
MGRCLAGAGGILVALAWAVHRADLLWCEARSIPLGVLWRPQGFFLGDMPDLHGRTALVTGANTGLGLETARQLALANATVLLGCRDTAKCAAAARLIGSAVEGRGSRGVVRTVRLDLADLRQVAAAADTLLRDLTALDILVNNAGIATRFPRALTVDGLEVTFQVNYLAHFLLTQRLLPLLQAANRTAAPRVVHLSSGAHRGAPAEGVPLCREAVNGAAMGAYARYGMAKLASLVFAQELARRAPGVLSNAVHPGVVATELLREGNFQRMLGAALGSAAFRLAQLRNALFAYTPVEAARTVLYCAVSPDVERAAFRGAFFVPIARQWPARHPKASDPQFGAALWGFSERLIADALVHRGDGAWG